MGNEHGEPEQLGVNVLSVATDDLDPREADKVMQKIRRWNSGHAMKLLATAPPVETSWSLLGLLQKTVENLFCCVCIWCYRVCCSGDKMGVYSDREEAEKGGNITAINIKKSRSGYFIEQIRLRYGNTWAPWRRCSDIDDGGEEEIIELGSNEGINRLRGCSWATGNTRSLEATTTTGRTWGPHGSHKPDAILHLDVDLETLGIFSLRPSPDANNLTLRFISGDQTAYKWILRFHWEVTPSMDQAQKKPIYPSDTKEYRSALRIAKKRKEQQVKTDSLLWILHKS